MKLANRIITKLSEGSDSKQVGYIAHYNGKKLEIPLSIGSLWYAKKEAIRVWKVPKSKESLVSVNPAYDESYNENMLRKVAKGKPSENLTKVAQYLLDNKFDGFIKDDGKGKVSYKDSLVEITAGGENIWLDIAVKVKDNHEEFIKETAKYLEIVSKLN